MSKIIINMITSLAFLAFFTSCATQKAAEQNVEKKINTETALTQEEVVENARKYILKSESLTETQKKDLITLQDKNYSMSKSLREEINKSKLVYIKTVLQPNVNEREASLLVKKIKKLSKKRMELDSKLFSEARKIIDPLKEVRDREFLYNSFMMRHNYYW